MKSEVRSEDNKDNDRAGSIYQRKNHMNTPETHLLPTSLTDPTCPHSLSSPQAPTRRGLRVEVRMPRTVPPAGESGVEDATAAKAPQAILDFIASNERVDRYDEVIVASGWNLEAYQRNPVFQNSHQYGDILFTIGKALVTEVRDDCLFQRIQFAVEVNPFARIAYGLYRGGFLNAVSVGFLPLRWEDGGAKSPWRRRYLEQELLEVSAVGIPANPDALQIGLKSGAIARQDVKEAAELLCHLLQSFQPTALAGSSCRPTGSVGSSRRDDRPVADTTARLASAPCPERFCSLDCVQLARWLQFARDIHAVMKRD